jgi:hypothetical protein
MEILDEEPPGEDRFKVHYLSANGSPLIAQGRDLRAAVDQAIDREKTGS